MSSSTPVKRATTDNAIQFKMPVCCVDFQSLSRQAQGISIEAWSSSSTEQSTDDESKQWKTTRKTRHTGLIGTHNSMAILFYCGSEWLNRLMLPFVSPIDNAQPCLSLQTVEREHSVVKNMINPPASLIDTLARFHLGLCRARRKPTP